MKEEVGTDNILPACENSDFLNPLGGSQTLSDQFVTERVQKSSPQVSSIFNVIQLFCIVYVVSQKTN